MPATRWLRLVISLCAALIVAGACAGEGAPWRRQLGTGSARVQRPRATHLETPKPKKCKQNLVKAAFKYDRGIEPADRTFVKKVTKQAITYFQLRTPDCANRDAVDVRLYAKGHGNLIARAAYGEIQVFTGSAGWEAVIPAARAQVIFHEWYHVLQRTLSIAPPPPTWFIEGSAEWAGFEAAVHFGYFDSMDYVREFIRYDARTPPKPLERANAENRGVYSLFFTGVDFLISKFGGKKRLRQFWERYDPGLSWKQVFRKVFHVKLSTFLKKFKAHRAAGFSS